MNTTDSLHPVTPSPRGRPPAWRRGLADRVTALILLGISIALLVTAVGYGLFVDSSPGPGLFPAIVSGALVVLALVWFIVADGPEPNPEHAAVFADEDDDEVDIDRAGWVRITMIIALALIPLLLLESLGYLLTMTAYLTAMLIINARVRPWVAVLSSLVGSVITLVGADALGIILPDPFGFLAMMGR